MFTHVLKERAFLPVPGVPEYVVGMVRAGIIGADELEEAGFGIYVEAGTLVRIEETLTAGGQTGHVLHLPDGRHVIAFDSMVEEVAEPDLSDRDWFEFESSLNDGDDDYWL